MKIQLTIISLMGLSIAQAQDIKPVKTYYVGESDKQVGVIDSARYIRTIGLIKSTDKTYKVTEYYLNNVVKKTANSYTRSFSPQLNGNVVSYSPKGIKTSEENFKGSKLTSGNYYYPNSKLKKSVIFNLEGIEQLIELNDFLGTSLLDKNKSGVFKITDENENLVEGSYINGLQNGIWKTYDTKEKDIYSEVYSSGIFVKGQLTTPDGKTSKYKSIKTLPQFVGGISAFSKYLSSTLRYPKEARDAKIDGRVFISFIIEKDGSITEAQVVRGIAPSLDEEALRVVSNSPKWIPGSIRGKPVRTNFTVPIFFKLQEQTIQPNPRENGGVDAFGNYRKPNY